MTFAAIDWMMSIDARLVLDDLRRDGPGGWGLSALCVAVVVGVAADPVPAATRRSPTPVGFNDLGNLMLAFTMLWAYMSFSQYLIIWSGNLAEEVPWYLERSVGGWRYVAASLMVFHFFVPFFCLLVRENKRRPDRLWRIAAAILVMHFVNDAWLIIPAFPGYAVAEGAGAGARGAGRRRALAGGRSPGAWRAARSSRSTTRSWPTCSNTPTTGEATEMPQREPPRTPASRRRDAPARRPPSAGRATRSATRTSAAIVMFVVGLFLVLVVAQVGLWGLLKAIAGRPARRRAADVALRRVAAGRRRRCRRAARSRPRSSSRSPSSAANSAAGEDGDPGRLRRSTAAIDLIAERGLPADPAGRARTEVEVNSHSGDRPAPRRGRGQQDTPAARTRGRAEKGAKK